MHFPFTPVKNQSSLVLPRGSSQLSTRGTGRGWQILQLIHERQSRGTAFTNPMGTGKGSGGNAARNERSDCCLWVSGDTRGRGGKGL